MAPPVVRKLTKASSMVGKPCGWVSQPPSGLLAGAGEMKRLVADPGHIDAILIDGSDRARAIADETMKRSKDIVGFIRRR